MLYKCCKIHIGLWRLSDKKYIKYLFNTFGLLYIDLIFWIYWFKQYVLLKLVLLASFYILILATRKFKIMYMAHSKYLWTGLDARVRLSIRKTSIKFLVLPLFNLTFSIDLGFYMILCFKFPHQ